MNRRTVVQPGEGAAPDLFVYCHIQPDAVAKAARSATRDAVVVELFGYGTSTYKQLLPAYGGSWASYVRGVEAKLSRPLRHTCLTTWSAGSQVAKDVCRAMAEAGELGGEGRYAGRLSALVLLDGLYAEKPRGARQGDGKVAADAGLRALGLYALAAARGECVMVVFHSAIPTPYASSAETARWLREYVEAELGVAMVPDRTLSPADLDGHQFREALALGDLHLVSFPGATGSEHVREAHLFDEVWRRWVPWATDASAAEERVPSTLPATTLGELALRLSLAEEEAGVGEEPPGTNRVKLAYWAGCTRYDPKRGEFLLKLTEGPWCATSFQWATYEAARKLGLLTGLDPADGWRSGPVPHGRRVSVAELQADMTARGLYRAASLVRSGAWRPAPGDAVFLDRPGGAGGGWGHVTRFARDLGDGKRYEAVGGNEGPDGSADRDDRGDRWRRRVRRYDDPLLRGFGSFDLAGAREAPPRALHAGVAEALETSRLEWLGRERPELAPPSGAA
jgi:hypothetical protein